MKATKVLRNMHTTVAGVRLTLAGNDQHIPDALPVSSPVMYAESVDARNETSPAMSSGRPR